MVLDVRPTSFVEQIEGERVRRVDVYLVSQLPTPNPLSTSYQVPGAQSPAGISGAPQVTSPRGGVEPTPQPVNININGIYPSLGGIQPQLRNDPNQSGGTVVGPAPQVNAPQNGPPTQMQILDGVIELWVGATDGFVRAAHLRMNVPSSRQDRPGRLEPVWQDTWVWFEDINEPFTITAPMNLTPPTPQPALATAIARATEEAASAANRPTTSGPTSSGPIPLPVRGAPTDPSAGGVSATPSGLEPRPVGTADANVAASERALLALASASGPRTGSKVTEVGVMLDVPWRGTIDSSGATVSTDGPAALGMVLESFGVTAPTADLQALATRWDEVRTDGDSVSIETLVRMAERGALRPIGTGRGPGGGDWTAAMAREFIRKGYPVLALVRPQVLTGGAVDPEQADRFIVLVGYDGDDVIYHDPTVENGAARRIDSMTLDQSWSQATPPRQGVVFGFGASVIGLLDGPGRSAQLRPEATATPQPITIRTTPTTELEPTPVVSEQAPAEGSGPHPALLAFLGILAGGVGFLIARLYR
jgi:hypothetical protein